VHRSAAPLGRTRRAWRNTSRTARFTVEILDAAAVARTRASGLIPEGASVFTGASETLRLSGIEADINTSGRYQAVKPRTRGMDRLTEADEIRRLHASPDAVVGSVAAVTETGSLVAASFSGSQLPAYSGGATVIQRDRPPSGPERRTGPRAQHRPAAAPSHRILTPPESRRDDQSARSTRESFSSTRWSASPA
jgi:LUD domain